MRQVFIILTLIFGISSISIAQSALQISANNITLNQDGFSTYSGNVIIVKGDTKLVAQEITILREEKKIIQVYAVGTSEHPVTYKDKTLAIEALAIKHKDDTNVITITGGVKIVNDGTSISADKISYNTLTKSIKIQSNENNRVHTIITPKDK